jgi:hypothetical protein
VVYVAHSPRPIPVILTLLPGVCGRGGLKENVILGRLIPAGTGLERYRNIQLLTEMPPPPPPEEILPPAELSAEEAAALDFLRKDADALAEGGSD